MLACGADLSAKGREGLSALNLLGERISRECLIVLLQQKYQVVPKIFDGYIEHAFKRAFQYRDIFLLELMAAHAKGKTMWVSEKLFKNGITNLIKYKNKTVLILIYKLICIAKSIKNLL